MLFKHRIRKSGFPDRPLSQAPGRADNTPRAADAHPSTAPRALSLRRGCAARRRPRRCIFPARYPQPHRNPRRFSHDPPAAAPLPAGRLPSGQPPGACRTALPFLKAPPMPRLSPRPGSSAMAPGLDPAPGLARPLAVPRRRRGPRGCRCRAGGREAAPSGAGGFRPRLPPPVVSRP